jgi:NAD(P)-dependent dehydrogenase (short-subunit alcohol dehydrogenase family)
MDGGRLRDAHRSRRGGARAGCARHGRHTAGARRAAHAGTLVHGSRVRRRRRRAAALGGIDILVNSAARVGGARGDVENVSFDDVLRDFNEKVVGSLRLAQEAVPFMKQGSWGRIITISGSAARSPGTQISGGARNSALVTVTRAMAMQLGQYGINVTVIYPGQTITEASIERYTEQAQSEGRSIEAIMDEAAQKTLLRHLVTADDIANAAAFLCSPLSVGITGEAIAVNGGQSTEVHH